MEKILITILIAVTGGFIGHQLRIPAGAMIGAMIFVGIANVSGVKTQVPEFFGIIGQVMIGSLLGLSITYEVMKGLKEYLIPSFLVVILLAIFGVVTGFIVNKITGIELYTSLFSSVPGGMQEMVILSQSYDVIHPAVMTIQTVRRVLIVVIYPILVHIVSKLNGNIIGLTGK